MVVNRKRKSRLMDGYRQALTDHTHDPSAHAPNTPTAPLRRAVEELLGGLTATSRLCGVTPVSVQKWLRAGGVPTLAHALTIADAAGIDIRTLRVP